MTQYYLENDKLPCQRIYIFKREKFFDIWRRMIMNMILKFINYL